MRNSPQNDTTMACGNLVRLDMSFWMVGKTIAPPKENMMAPKPRKKDCTVGGACIAASTGSSTRILIITTTTAATAATRAKTDTCLKTGARRVI